MAATTTDARGAAGLSGPLAVAAIASVLGVVTFFLPWFTLANGTHSGLSFAALQPSAYLVPLAGLSGTIMALLAISRPEERGRWTTWLIASALVGLVISLALLVTALAQGGNPQLFGVGGFQGAGVGAYLTVVAFAAAVVASGIALAGEGAPSAAEVAAAEAENPVVRRVVVAGLLGAIAMLLGYTRIGFIPFPTGVNATIMHIPAIIGGVAEGWVVGWAIGTIFGIFSFLNATTPAFKDPIVAILPRMFIGITSYVTFRALAPLNYVIALVITAAVGTLTNTILVLGLGTIRGYFTPELAFTIALTNGVPEVIVAALLVVPVVRAVKGFGGLRKSSV